MAYTTKTTLASAIQTVFEQKVMQKVDQMLAPIREFASIRTIEKGAGGTYKVNRLLSLAKVTSATSEGTVLAITDAGKFDTEYLSFTPTVFCDARAITREADWDSILQNSDYQDAIADQIARTLAYYTLKTMCTNALRIRSDSDTDYETAGTTDSGSTSTLVDTELTGKGAAWDSAYFTPTTPTGPCYGEAKKATGYVEGTGTVTIDFTSVPTSSTKYWAATPLNLTSTDKFSTTALRKVAFFHKQLQTPKFTGGVYHGFLHPQQEFDLWSDTVWENSAIYDDSERFKDYQLIRWAGLNLLVPGNEGYRETTSAVESETGDVYLAPIFGKNAYTILKWFMGQDEYAVRIHKVDQPDRVDLNAFVRALSWDCRFSVPVLDACKIIAVMSGASETGLLVR